MMRQISWGILISSASQFAEWTREGKLRKTVFVGLRKAKIPGCATR